MSFELGDYDIYGSDAIVLTYESNGSGSAGDFVTVNSSDQVAPTSDGDTIFGVLAEDSPSSGEDVAVVKFGDVVANSASGVTAGDVVETSTTSGQAAANSEGKEKAVDEGGTATYTLAQANPEALVDAGGTLPDGTSLGSNETVVYLK